MEAWQKREKMKRGRTEEQRKMDNQVLDRLGGGKLVAKLDKQTTLPPDAPAVQQVRGQRQGQVPSLVFV